ncbi:MAG: hypothetical protein NC938_06510 [Candidatus Omnitrophica bacterium]|nr:hypothetical protein [Candidatus Omnitrophota bacterium]MCM8791328.1 hypothetical protein [Candidatus Omnitrophota bacterium]
MPKEEPSISLESLEFLIRHPWCFIYPFTVLLFMTLAYVMSLPKVYECHAVVSFGSAAVETLPQRFTQRKENLISKVLLGDNIKKIIGIVWPGISEEANPLRYAMIRNGLRNPKGGIKFQFDRRDANIVDISFTGYNPDICYKVVQATIDVIRMENSRSVEEAIDASIVFLTRQINLYRDRLAAIDSEMLKVSAKLREMAMSLDVEQRELVNRITSEVVTQRQLDNRAAMGEVRSADVMADLEMKLVEARKKKELLAMRIERKDFEIAKSESRDLREGIFEKAVEQKKLLMLDMVARGYLPEHPAMKSIQKGIDDIENLRQKQMEDMVAGKEGKLSESEKKVAEKLMRDELEETEFLINTLEEKIKVLKGYRANLEKGTTMEETLVGPVASEAAKLKSLRDEKEMITRYYNELRKQLEDADLKRRAEKTQAGFQIEVIEPPRVPLSPLPSQKAGRLLLGIIIAIGAGSALSYVVDSLDKSVRSAAELRDKFHLPVLASIDRIYSVKDIKLKRAERNLIVGSMAAIIIAGMIAVNLAVKMFRM